MLKKEELIKQLDQLVRLPTLPGNFAENQKALDLVVSWLAKSAQIVRLENKGTEILLASNQKTMTPDFGYMVHMDVVAAPDSMFKVSVDGDRLLGRGVSDMKFSVPLGVALLNELIEQKSDLSFTLCITTDEEVGGYAGGAWLAKEYGWKPKTLIVPDGGDNLRFVEKGKGVCQLQVTSTGVATHASRVWEGKNAIPSLAKLTVELDKLFGKTNQSETWETTLNFGQFNAGISVNQVCDLAVLRLDFRFPETSSVEEIEAMVKKLAKAIDPELKVERMSTGLPTFTDINLPVVKDFFAAMEIEVGQKLDTMGAYGASDARHFAHLKTPVLMLKPMGGDIHALTEWISLSSTMQFYQGLRRFLGLKS